MLTPLYCSSVLNENSLSVQFAAMRDVSATETAIIYGLEPIWGAGFAWFLLGERWGTLGWIGASLVLGKYFILLLALLNSYSFFKYLKWY